MSTPTASTGNALTARRRSGAAARIVTGLLVAALGLTSALAVAQEAQPQKEDPGLLESVGKWFDEQGQKIGSTFKGAGKTVESFGHEAGIAAKTTVEGAKDAAGAVARIPVARVVTGHEKCLIAPNGAPDCVAAATTMCKAKGFDSGKSADMTTADVCPAHVYLAGRSSGPGCRTETFVSRALCQ
jgi:hypothetical protein